MILAGIHAGAALGMRFISFEHIIDAYSVICDKFLDSNIFAIPTMFVHPCSQLLLA